MRGAELIDGHLLLQLHPSIKLVWPIAAGIMKERAAHRDPAPEHINPESIPSPVFSLSLSVVEPRTTETSDTMKVSTTSAGFWRGARWDLHTLFVSSQGSRTITITHVLTLLFLASLISQSWSAPKVKGISFSSSFNFMWLVTNSLPLFLR